MMKRFYVLTMLLLCFFSFSQTSETPQIGIGTTSPTETLDVNGTVRIRETDDIGEDSYMVLVKNDLGIVKELDRNTFVISTERKKIKVGSKKSVLVTNDQNFESANIIILTRNACDRNMISSFQAFSGALVFLKGLGRDISATENLIRLPPNGVTYSATWKISFPNLTECKVNGKNHFDFTLLKTNNNTYQITNDGNEEREYTFIFQKI